MIDNSGLNGHNRENCSSLGQLYFEISSPYSDFDVMTFRQIVAAPEFRDFDFLRSIACSPFLFSCKCDNCVCVIRSDTVSARSLRRDNSALKVTINRTLTVPQVERCEVGGGCLICIETSHNF